MTIKILTPEQLRHKHNARIRKVKRLAYRKFIKDGTPVARTVKKYRAIIHNVELDERAQQRRALVRQPTVYSLPKGKVRWVHPAIRHRLGQIDYRDRALQVGDAARSLRVALRIPPCPSPVFDPELRRDFAMWESRAHTRLYNRRDLLRRKCKAAVDPQMYPEQLYRLELLFLYWDDATPWLISRWLSTPKMHERWLGENEDVRLRVQGEAGRLEHSQRGTLT